MKDRKAGETETPEDMHAAADAWWDAAAAERDREFRSAMQVRAAALYRRILRTSSAAEQRRAKTRIDAAVAEDVRRIKPDRAAALSSILAWLNRAPGLAIAVTEGGAAIVPADARVRFLDPLAEFNFTELHARGTRLACLAFLRDQPLVALNIGGTAVVDLRPLAHMPIAVLHVNYCPVADISPVATLRDLEVFHAEWTPVTDFKPLRGLGVSDLNLSGTAAGDAELAWLAGLPLKNLFLRKTAIASLEPLKGKPLELLWIEETAVADLGPLDGMPLHTLALHNMIRPIDDYSPVYRIATLKHLTMDIRSPEQRDMLRKMNLETLNGRPAAEALKEGSP